MELPFSFSLLPSNQTEVTKRGNKHPLDQAEYNMKSNTKRQDPLRIYKLHITQYRAAAVGSMT